MNIHESAENYLEAILIIKKRKRLGSFYRYRQSPELFKAQRKRGNEKICVKTVIYQ